MGLGVVNDFRKDDLRKVAVFKVEASVICLVTLESAGVASVMDASYGCDSDTDTFNFFIKGIVVSADLE